LLAILLEVVWRLPRSSRFVSKEYHYLQAFSAFHPGLI
jgi:hypothetical protein